MWVFDEEIGMNQREITYVPGLYKIFDEILGKGLHTVQLYALIMAPSVTELQSAAGLCVGISFSDLVFVCTVCSLNRDGYKHHYPCLWQPMIRTAVFIVPGKVRARSVTFLWISKG